MTWFAVRVELHKNDDEHEIPESAYRRLHADMALNGYYRFINNRDGRPVMLPPAEYFLKTSTKIDASAIRDELVDITKHINRKSTIYVVITNHWAAMNLPFITDEQAEALRTTGNL